MPQIEQVVVTNNNTGLPGIHSILVMRFWSQMVALNAWSATPAQPIPLLRALSTIAMLTRLSGYIRDKAYDFALPTYIPTQENPTLPRCTHSVVRADRTVGRRPPPSPAFLDSFPSSRFGLRLLPVRYLFGLCTLRLSGNQSPHFNRD
jgi:hypothetical protein